MNNNMAHKKSIKSGLQFVRSASARSNGHKFVQGLNRAIRNYENAENYSYYTRAAIVVSLTEIRDLIKAHML